MNHIDICEDNYLLTALTTACRLRNDCMRVRLPIEKEMLKILLRKTHDYFLKLNQPYLAILYQAILSTMYFGLFGVSEVATGAHPILARDVQVGTNKCKMLFILRSSKTHAKNMPPQQIKISAKKDKRHINDADGGLPLEQCPYMILDTYSKKCGGYIEDNEPFFVFHDRSPVQPRHVAIWLTIVLRKCGFDHRYYGTHSLRAGQSCDLYKLGVPIEDIKKIGRWKSNAIFRYLKN